jgi:hypothetical protein
MWQKWVIATARVYQQSYSLAWDLERAPGKGSQVHPLFRKNLLKRPGVSARLPNAPKVMSNRRLPKKPWGTFSTCQDAGSGQVESPAPETYSVTRYSPFGRIRWANEDRDAAVGV